MRYGLLFFSLMVGALTAQTVSVQVVSGGGQNAMAGTEFGLPLTIQVTNPVFGTPIAGVPVTITLPPDGTIAGATMNAGLVTVTLTTNSQGIVVSPVLSANKQTGSYQGTATASGQSATFRLNNTGLDAPIVSADQLFFSMNLGDAVPPPQTVVINSPTDGYSATTDATWVKITLRSNTVMVVGVDPTGLGPGHYTGNVVVNGQTIIGVSLTITQKPLLFSLAGTAGLSFTYVQFTPRGSPRPADQFVTIWSSQRNLPVIVDQTYVSPVNGKWLAAASKRGTVTPLTLEIVVDPTGLAPGTYQANIRVSSGETTNNPLLIPVTLVVRRFPTARAPEISSVANGASSEEGAVSAGGLVALSSEGMSCTEQPVVTVDGMAAQLVGAKGGRIGVLIPDVAGRSRSQLQLSCDNQASEAFSVPVAPAAPGIFASEDGRVVADNSKTNTGRRVIRIYGTGFGPVTRVDESGKQTLAMPVRVWMGGVQGKVLSVTPSADLAGVMEMMVQVPETVDPGSTVSLDLMIGDVPAQAGLTVAVN